VRAFRYSVQLARPCNPLFFLVDQYRVPGQRVFLRIVGSCQRQLLVVILELCLDHKKLDLNMKPSTAGDVDIFVRVIHAFHSERVWAVVGVFTLVSLVGTEKMSFTFTILGRTIRFGV
jgi:hypothetical protein